MDTVQLVQPVLHFRRIPLEHPGHDRGVELVALHAGRHQQAAVVFAELTDLPLDHAADRFGQVAPEVGDRLPQRPAALLLRQHLSVSKVAQEVGHEQRAALRPGVDEGRELLREAMPGEFEREIAVEIRSGQELQRQLATDAAHLQVQLDRPERVLAQHQVGRAIGQHQQGTHPRAPAAEVGEQINGRGVRPVQIIEEQEQRPQVRHLPQEGTQLALQAFLGGRFRLGEHARQGGVFRGQRHDLRVPIRGGRLHHPCRCLTHFVVEQALQGIEKRQIGLGPGEALQQRRAARRRGGRWPRARRGNLRPGSSCRCRARPSRTGIAPDRPPPTRRHDPAPRVLSGDPRNGV